MQSHTTAIFALAFTALLGCDAPDNDVSFRGAPPLLWSDGDKGCDDVFLKTEEGTICAPKWYDAAKCVHQQYNACGQAVGHTPQTWKGACVHACFTAADCQGGMVCSTWGVCLWENSSDLPPTCAEPPAEPCGVGEAFGPCFGNNTCDPGMSCITVFDGFEGSDVCAPTCSGYDANPVTQECKDGISLKAPSCNAAEKAVVVCVGDDDCLNGTHCHGGMCLWPK
jgi:hypothetical protein